MKIALSLIPGSGDNTIEEFMKRVDDDVSHMRSLPSNFSTLGQVSSAKPESSDIERLTIHSSTILGAPRQSQVKPTETIGCHCTCVQDGKLSQ